ncbi:aromatic ring-hydroxylating dioxygenase subunit alpha [Mesorhizobium sp.]|uniref:aromatic ring-hydroxylating oxygenase subunit alpha n=1 Tax=Mesorhizobium sp. TaxID=1871066 RepID=UPI000FE7CFBE|nr:aromatic ring-hydroxylating dioxygenase subunit alpha [Mesorhizobium sp.]RWP08596.1 MAG: aromatic ring-hydroxylating dioxygenase subunit alpha [Mesorhizobium sp.]TIU39405.1 MAG: aromatic ring-hydroxylating dioxygenase subunit alpha [Mesorhizobium sp.]
MSVHPIQQAPTDGDAIDRLVASHQPGHGLVRAFYHDPAIFERDIERVFRRHWHCLAHASVIPNPGDFELFKLGDEAVILTRGMDGTVHAMLNVCRHRGAEVCTKEKGNAKMFVCPYHAWAYSNDGSLRAARLMPKDFDRSAHGLKKLHVRVASGLVFISFAETPLDFDPIEQSLRTSCGQYGWGDAKVAYRQSYALDANWKLAVENYVECYHCGPAHPEYSQTHALEKPAEMIEQLNAAMEQRTCALGIEIGSANRWQNSAAGQEAIHTFRYALYDGVSSGSKDGSPVAPLMGRFTDYDGGVTSIHLGGMTFLVCYPDHGMIYRFIPKTAGTCEMELIWLVRGDAVEGQDYDLEKLTWLWKVTTEEDKKIIEHTARGVRSHYFVPGPIAPMEYNELRYIGWYLEEISRA